MKKVIFLLIAVVCVAISENAQNIVNKDNSSNELLAYTTSSDECTVRIFESNGGIKYTNNCNESKHVKIVYRYKTCKNVAENGRMVKKWSDWSNSIIIYRNLSARYSNATIVSGDNCTIYDLIDWNFAK